MDTSTETTESPPTTTTETATTTGGYTDYILRSSDPSHEWRYNIMKFAALGDRQVNPSADNFVQPVKLNRKDPRTVRRLTDEERDKMNLKAAESGVIKDVTEVKKEGGGPNNYYKPAWKKDREEIDLTLVGVGTSGNQPKVRNKANMFKKKIKRVFVSSEEARRLKREEWMPWVLEDDEGNERWIGRLEGGTGESSTNTLAASASALKKTQEADANGTGMTGWRPSAAASEAGGGGSSYVAFVFGKGGDDFKVVPASRWYKFSRGPRHATLGTEEAEEEYNRLQKSQEPERWMMHRRTAPQASTSTDSSSTSSVPTGKGKLKLNSKTAPAPSSNIRSRILDKSVLSLPKLDAGRPKLRSIIKGNSGGNGDDELRGRKSRGDGGRGQEQEDDEFDYEEDFQDDEEGIAKIDDLADEQETRDVADRIKKEMRGANRFDMEVDEDEEEDDLTNTGKELKKLVKKGDKEGAYESDNDDFDNPYASSEYDDEDEATSVTVADSASEKPRTSSSQMNRTSSHKSSSNSQHRRNGGTQNSSHSNRNSNSNSRAGSRSGSPALAASTSAAIAKRAASPGTNSNGGGRGSKPGSRGSSPSSAGGGGGGGKRKRVEELGDESDGARRKRNTETPPPLDDSNLMKETDLINYLKSRGEDKPTTKEVLSHFKKEFKADSRNKSNISGLLRAVADLVVGKLELKAGL